MHRATVERIDRASRCIPAEDRDTWVRVGMAIHSALGESGFSLWDYWSQSASNYDERAAQHVWRSFKSGRTQIGTLFHIAREHGYRPGRETAARTIPTRKPLPSTGSTAKYAAEIWLRADFRDKIVTAHPYAVAKGIASAGGVGRVIASGCKIGKDADCIVVPIRDLDTWKVRAVQCINAQGAKQTFGAASGNGLLLGNTLDKTLPWFVAEGWATAYSMVFHHQDGHGVCAVAFGKGNLDKVAHRLSVLYAPDRVVILREVDK